MARLISAGFALAALLAGCAPGPTVTSGPEPVMTTVTAATTTSLPETTTTDVEPVALPSDDRLPVGGPIPLGAPDRVVDREPLPYCGAEAVLGGDPSRPPYLGIAVVEGASDCYHDRAASGRPAELVVVATTIEGDPIMSIRRLLPDGTVELFTDFTRDGLGSGTWVHRSCDGYEPPGSLVENCRDEVDLGWTAPMPPEHTVVDVTTGLTVGGPPFYVEVGDLESAADGWAMQQIRIVSEWDGRVAVGTAPLRYVLHAVDVAQPVDPGDAPPTLLEPGQSAELEVRLDPPARHRLVPGVYRIVVPIPYWRDGDGGLGTLPDGTLEVSIDYEVLDGRAVEAIESFCPEAVAAASEMTTLDETTMRTGLGRIQRAAISLPELSRRGVVDAAADLATDLDAWFGSGSTSGGFDSIELMASISRLCRVELEAVAIQA